MQEEFQQLSLQLRLLLMTLAGLLIMLGFRKKGTKLFYSVIVAMLLMPILYALVQQLPLWISIAVVIVFLLMTIKRLVGNEAWGQFVGSILYDVLWKTPLKLIWKLLRSIGNLFRKH